MALIKCPECYKNVSDKAEICIHCGYPLKNDNHSCYINGVQYDLSHELRLITQSDFMQGLRNLRDKYHLDLADATTLGNIIKNTKQIPKEYKSEDREKYKGQVNVTENENLNRNIPKCPTCGSTNVEKILTGKRFWEVQCLVYSVLI